MSAEATPLDVIEGHATWCVVEGDAMTVARSMPDASVDAVVMDPPYGVKIAEWDDDIPPQAWLDECLRVSRGPVLWFGAAVKALEFGRYSPRPDRMLVWAPSFALSCSAAHGLMFRWHPIAAWRPKAIRGAIHCDVLTHKTDGRNTWNHPCTKPVALMRDIVEAFVPDGGIVADFTAGSGTTGVGALLRGRRAVLVERDPVHAATCVARMEATQPGEGSRKAKQLALGGVR